VDVVGGGKVRRGLGAVLLILVLSVATFGVAACSRSSSPSSSAPVVQTSPTPSGPLTTAQYSDATRKIAADYTIEFRRMGTLVSSPAFDNPTWRQNLSDVVAAIKAIGARMRALMPPACLADVHTAQVQAASSYDQMADLLAAGVQNNDEDALAQSAQFLNDGNSQITTATTLLGSAHC
jgi:hypothetical protein